MDFNFSDFSEHVMAENMFYGEAEVKVETRPRSLSLSIQKPDWTGLLNTSEKSLRFTDTLLDTPEILSQCVDWQLHRQPETEQPQQQQYYLPESVDESSKITAIKNELQNDYENAASPPAKSPAATAYYYDSVTDSNTSRACDGSVSPALSEAHSSMVADDEGDDDTWYPSTVARRRVGRPRASPVNNNNNTTTTKPTKSHKRKLSDYNKESVEYQEKRKRNNIAVRKSRDKAKRHHVEVEERNRELEKTNGDLRKQNESLVREVSVLRKLITDIGRKIPTDLAVSLESL